MKSKLDVRLLYLLSDDARWLIADIWNAFRPGLASVSIHVVFDELLGARR